jgi:hypothetical protein
MQHKTLPLRHKLLFFVLAASLLSSCSHKMTFADSVAVPAASGHVKYKKDRNGNYAIHLKVLNMAPSTSLQPARDTYVVWMESRGNGVQNLGKMNSSSGLLSKALKASLDAVSPYEPRSFFITAEDDAQLTYPGPDVILRTR